ncbi:MAG: CehA/McbA family metallohydrolase [Rhodobacterales bacterium]|nr:CehA/McbA family metallohydrolase [Rhodobacterales bacterium]
MTADHILGQLPFAAPGRFWRGNMHMHSTRSDGAHGVAEACAAYAREGYDFVAMTDHFLPQYDYPITDTRACRTDRFVTLAGAELHQGRLSNGELWHITAVGLPWNFAAPTEDETAAEICTRATEAGAFLAFAHPGWFALTPEDTRTLPMVHAVEVYNHGTETGQMRGDGWYLTDMVLNEGRRLTAVANDDMHRLGLGFGGGWTMVKADVLTPEAVLAALHAGQFYASQGPVIHDIRIEDDMMVVDCSPVVTAALVGSRARRIAGQITEIATRVRLPLAQATEGYMRLILRDRHGRHAWTNPVWLD